MPSLGDIDIRYSYTGNAVHGLSPWCDSNFIYSMLQLNLAYNPISRLEVVSYLNTQNIGAGYFYYDLQRTSRYNPKLYLGALNSSATGWNNQTEVATPSLSWPESFVKFITLL